MEEEEDNFGIVESVVPTRMASTKIPEEDWSEKSVGSLGSSSSSIPSVVESECSTITKQQHDTTTTTQHKIVVPPGPLGIILEKNTQGGGGHHVVNRVKESSSLQGQVYPGDLIVSIDDTSTTPSAAKVSFAEQQGTSTKGVDGMEEADHSSALSDVGGPLPFAGAKEESEQSPQEETNVPSSNTKVITAPPGKLGLLVDSTPQGYPVINRVKNNSPLQNQLFPGDRLVKINDMDTYDMTGSDLSQAMVSTASTSRVLVIMSKEMAATPVDDDEHQGVSMESNKDSAATVDVAATKGLLLESQGTTTSSSTEEKGLLKVVITAPREGKLGIVVDSTPEGPRIHEIKAGSPIKGQLQKGDHIVNINDTDTQGMAGVVVAALLGRVTNAPRVITVLRKAPLLALPLADNQEERSVVSVRNAGTTDGSTTEMGDLPLKTTSRKLGVLIDETLQGPMVNRVELEGQIYQVDSIVAGVDKKEGNTQQKRSDASTSTATTATTTSTTARAWMVLSKNDDDNTDEGSAVAYFSTPVTDSASSRERKSDLLEADKGAATEETQEPSENTTDETLTVSDENVKRTPSSKELASLEAVPSMADDSDGSSLLRPNMTAREVKAPPGKLGIIVDATSDGPVVNSVKPGSALEGKLYEGDIIVRVNDEDTQHMSGHDLSALMRRTVSEPRTLIVLSKDDGSASLKHASALSGHDVHSAAPPEPAENPKEILAVPSKTTTTSRTPVDDSSTNPSVSDYATLEKSLASAPSVEQSECSSVLRQDMSARIVNAPPGKLGIVVGSTPDGPVVNRVKAGSALEGKIYQGDLIVKVNDEDTQQMLGSDLSALMARTISQPREFIVVSKDVVSDDDGASVAYSSTFSVESAKANRRSELQYAADEVAAAASKEVTSTSVGDTKTSSATALDATSGRSLAPLPSTEQSTCSSVLRQDMSPRKVRAPPGSLGVVVGSTPDGPVVDHVKSSSSLEGQLYQGDLIVKVGDEDTQQMSGHDVSMLMAETASKTRSLLVLSEDVVSDDDGASLRSFERVGMEKDTKTSGATALDVTSGQSLAPLSSMEQSTCSSVLRQDMSPRKVRAPPGSLGVVVGSTPDGPVVNHVKSSSSLEGQLYQGDLIVKVGDEDTQQMSGHDVSMLMAETASQTRSLVVLSEDVVSDDGGASFVSFEQRAGVQKDIGEKTTPLYSLQEQNKVTEQTSTKEMGGKPVAHDSSAAVTDDSIVPLMFEKSSVIIPSVAESERVSVPGQDASARFVAAPPGRLRLKIRSTPDGPVVSQVKPGSSLEGKVYQGDRIVSVQIDTQHMSGTEFTDFMVGISAQSRVLKVLSQEAADEEESVYLADTSTDSVVAVSTERIVDVPDGTIAQPESKTGHVDEQQSLDGSFQFVPSIAESECSSLLRQDMSSRTVRAPPGKLGITVDTTPEGPMVNRVKPGSRLEGHIHVGDLIVSVNGEGTEGMSGTDLSALMARTSFQSRIMMVLSKDAT